MYNESDMDDQNKANPSHLKWYLIAIVAVLVVAAVAFSSLKINKYQTNEFAGIVSRVENGALIMDGNFITKDENNILITLKAENIRVNITPQTKIVKTIIHMPTSDEITAMGGFFRPENLKQDVIEVSPEVLISDLSVNKTNTFVRASSNIYGKKAFDAAEVQYTLPFAE